MATEKVFYKLLTHDYRPPLQGGGPVWDGKTLPFTLPDVPLDTSRGECGTKGGWHFVSNLAAGFCIAGVWPTGKPSSVFVVEPSHDAIQRNDKWRCSSLTLIRLASEEEIRKGIENLSEVFGEHAPAMVEEQISWRAALSRPRFDQRAVKANLRAALETRKLEWELRQYSTIKEMQQISYLARDAWAARAALTLFYAAKKGWLDRPANFLSIGIREAYEYGLSIALPTGPQELGWVMGSAETYGVSPL